MVLAFQRRRKNYQLFRMKQASHQTLRVCPAKEVPSHKKPFIITAQSSIEYLERKLKSQKQFNSKQDSEVYDKHKVALHHSLQQSFSFLSRLRRTTSSPTRGFALCAAPLLSSSLLLSVPIRQEVSQTSR
jgi:hypothetical protein